MLFQEKSFAVDNQQKRTTVFVEAFSESDGNEEVEQVNPPQALNKFSPISSIADGTPSLKVNSGIGNSGYIASNGLLSTSLFATQNIRTTSRFLIPVLILANIILYISSNLSIGANVELKLRLEKKVFGPFNLFDFSLTNTVSDMYSAKVYLLAVLVLAWSGVWPYLKLLLLLMSWFAPTSFFSIKKRKNLLLALDALGKWCILDTFLLVMMSVAFRFDLVLINKDIFGLNVSVLNKYGLHSFVVATVMSLILSHIILAYHRNAVKLLRVIDSQPLYFESEENGVESSQISTALYNDLLLTERDPYANVSELESQEPLLLQNNNVCTDSNRSRVLLRFVYSDTRKLKRMKMVSKLAIQFGTLLLLCLTFWLIVIGSTVEAFAFKFSGLAGEMIQIVDPSLLEHNYSLFSIGRALQENINNNSCSGTDLRSYTTSEILGIYFIESIYFLFAFIMPLCQVLLMFCLCFLPLSLRYQKIFYFVVEVIKAWSALDVFIVCIIAANLEISQFAYFLLKDECIEIEKAINYILPHNDKPCFDIETKFLRGIYLLVVAALTLFMSSYIVTCLTKNAIITRERLAYMNCKDRF